MMKKILILFFLCLLYTPFVFAQITFQETVIDTTNTVSIDVVSVSGIYSVDSTYPADFDGDGDLDVLVKSNPFLWIENTDGLGALSTEHLIDDGLNSIKDISAVDFDGDGDMDILLAENDFAVDVIAWYENLDGLGTFSQKLTISTQVDNPAAIFANDIDGDGDMDVLSSSLGDGKIAWYENTNGQGAFGAQQVIATASFSSTTQYIEVVSGDLDGDSDNDVLFASNGSPDEVVYWLENTNGLGTFGSPQEAFQVFGGLFYVRLADLDNDGDIDAYGQNTFDGLLSFNNDGLGNFTFGYDFPSSFDTYIGLFSRAIDLDNDADLDILAIAIDEQETNVSQIVWFENQDGQGSFGAETILGNLNITGNDYRFNTGDFNGDNFIDLVATSSDGYEISWNQNDIQNGAFGSANGILNELRDVTNVLSIDLDNDNDNDFVFSSYDYNTIGWYENVDGAGTFSTQKIVSTNGYGFSSIIKADINSDGILDLVSASQKDGKMGWYQIVAGTETFTFNQLPNLLIGVRIIQALDVDGDDDLDIVALESYDADKLVWFENLDGQGAFGGEQLITDTIGSVSSFDASDFDADGDLDIVIDDPLAWIENTDGQGNFGAVQIIDGSIELESVKAFDIDLDGDTDLLVSNPFGWFENVDGQASFGEFQSISDQFISDMQTVDIDNDGDKDVVASLSLGTNDREVGIFENFQGNFSAFKEVGITDRVSSLFTDDMDGNGMIDVLYSTRIFTGTSGKVGWYRNLGVLQNQIMGSVVFDINSDGCDESDIKVSNILVASGNSGAVFSTFTDSNGGFTLNVNQGDLFTTLTPDLPDYFSFSPSVHSTSFTGVNQVDDMANFCIVANESINDLNIVMYPLSDPRPGFDTSYQIVYNNIGSTTLSGTVELVFDSTKMQYLTASEVPSTQSGNLLVFDFTDLLPFESRSITVDFNVFAPPITNIDDMLSTMVTVNPATGDHTEEDNTYNLEQIVIDSFDPNDISVLEGEQILLEETDDYLHYIIRFQNTGTAEAVNVNVTNIIDPKLNWFTMQVQDLSHSGRVEISDGLEANFIFENINLPANSQDEAGSQGYITYRIKPMQNASIGDVFYNNASIFFDFNTPIITNTVSTEVVEPLSLNNFNSNPVSLYPNPSSGEIKLSTGNSMNSILIVDVNGKELKRYSNINDQDYTIDIGNLSNGIYFLKIIMDKKIVTKKIVKK